MRDREKLQFRVPDHGCSVCDRESRFTVESLRLRGFHASDKYASALSLYSHTAPRLTFCADAMRVAVSLAVAALDLTWTTCLEANGGGIRWGGTSLSAWR